MTKRLLAVVLVVAGWGGARPTGAVVSMINGFETADIGNWTPCGGCTLLGCIALCGGTAPTTIIQGTRCGSQTWAATAGSFLTLPTFGGGVMRNWDPASGPGYTWFAIRMLRPTGGPNIPVALSLPVPGGCTGPLGFATSGIQGANPSASDTTWYTVAASTQFFKNQCVDITNVCAAYIIKGSGFIGTHYFDQMEVGDTVVNNLPPTNLTCMYTGSNITLTWTPAVKTGTGNITGYAIYRKIVAGACPAAGCYTFRGATGPVGSYVDAAVITGNVYQYAVATIDDALTLSSVFTNPVPSTVNESALTAPCCVIMPTNTPTPTFPPSPTATITRTATNTFTATNTATSSPTASNTTTPCFTPTVTSTSLFTLTNSGTYTQTSSPVPTSTYTNTVPTSTYTPTYTESFTNTPTYSFTPTRTATDTRTDTATRTETFTRTETVANSVTATRTPSFSRTATSTITATPTESPTRTPTITIFPGLIWPNPVNFQTARDGAIKIGNLPALTKFFVYSVRGEIVRQIETVINHETLYWNGKNDVQAICPTGLYLYVLVFPPDPSNQSPPGIPDPEFENAKVYGMTFRGKIAVIR